MKILENIIAFLNKFSLPSFSFNFLDLAIVLVVIFYVHEGYVLGVTLASLDLLGFILSFIIALKLYDFIANILILLFSIPIGSAKAISFFITALVFEIGFSILFRKMVKHLPTLPQVSGAYRFFKKIDHFLGIIPGMISSFIILAFILTLITTMPSPPIAKDLVTDSEIGSRLVENTSFFEKKLNNLFGGALSDTLNFLTVEPKSTELVPLNFKITDGTIDKKAELEMLVLINKERTKAGIQSISMDEKLTQVARSHSKDMFERGYFSHNTPEGVTPSSRIEKENIKYNFAGENIALAPSTVLAMQGLMNSPAHRRNILSPNFNKIGIGVIDGGGYGKMYTQEFTD